MRGQALLAAGVMAMAVSFAGSANAQSYQAAPAYGAPAYGQAYDPNCKQRKTSNGVIGALVGATAGVLIGGSTYNGGHREDGRLIGGVLGAGAGAAIGAGGTNCNTVAYPTTQAASPPQQYGQRDGQQYGQRDDELLGGPDSRAYGDRNYSRDDGYRGDDGYASAPPPRRYAEGPRYSTQCRIAEQLVRDRWGRPYRTNVEICRDPYSGEWVVRR